MDDRTDIQSALEGMPPQTKVALREVAEHHRDRNDACDLRLGYALHSVRSATEETKLGYRKAHAALSQHLLGMHQKRLDNIMQAIKPRLNIGFFSPRELEFLKGLERIHALAHVLAHTFIRDVYYRQDVLDVSGIPGDSKVGKAHPELVQRLSPKDQLLSVADLSPCITSLTYREHSLQLHPGFRRHFAGNVLDNLPRLLWAAHKHGLEVKLAIDPTRLCRRGELLEVLEKDHWFGPPLRMMDLDNSNLVGSTVHARTRHMGLHPDERAGLRVHFNWSYKDGLKAFVAEECSPASPEHSKVRISRFIHAIRDTRSKRFVHLDGALHFYSPSAHRERFEQMMNGAAPRVWSGGKVKLFRIDATHTAFIDEQLWSSVTAAFFHGNELVVEYLSDRAFDDIYRETYGHDYPCFD